MTDDDVQKFGKNGMDMLLIACAAWSKTAQAIAVEIVDYSKKTAESSIAAWEKLVSAKTPEKALQAQTEYLKSFYEDFVTEATRLGELYVDLAREASTPFQGAVRKAASAVK
ncbi:MAG: phasin family protein [Xanthobacteraceae bacterium]